VPVFVFFDHNMRELGHFIERPAQATTEMQAATQQLAAQHPELPDVGGSFDTMSAAAKSVRFQHLAELRSQRGVVWAAMLLDDIERLLGAQASTR
jgi:hypothetical protein